LQEVNGGRADGGRRRRLLGGGGQRDGDGECECNRAHGILPAGRRRAASLCCIVDGQIVYFLDDLEGHRHVQGGVERLGRRRAGQADIVELLEILGRCPALHG